MSDPNAKRAAERVPGQLSGSVTVFQPMTILSISVKGMLMESAAALLNDSLHDFRLSLDDRSVVVKGRVVYCEIGELHQQGVLYRCGVEFIDVPAHALSAIGDFVAAHRTAPHVIDAEVPEE